MKNLFLQYRIFVYPLSVGLASLALIAFVIVPQLQGYLSGRDDLLQKQTRLNNLEVKAKELENFDQAVYSDKLLSAFYYLPVDKDLANIIGIFRELAAAAGMSLTSLFPSSGAETDSYTVKADVVGQSGNLGDLLDKIEKSPRVMQVVSVETSPSSSGLLNATLTVKVYFAPPPKSLGAIDAPLPKLTEADQIILSGLTAPSSQAPGQTIIIPTGKLNPFE